MLILGVAGGIGQSWHTRLLVETVRTTYPAHEQEQFAAHFRGLLGLWVSERGRTAQTA